MWEISSGQTPFNNYEHDYDLAMKVNGMRPKIRSEIPPGYNQLMKQCWDADPLKRPKMIIIFIVICVMLNEAYNNDNTNLMISIYLINNNIEDYNSSKNQEEIIKDFKGLKLDK
ncbi:hypothetical protein RirG_199690 [Rhizophagus irregularis DAOM 197198w]|uniref:Serine-threonine/tyrosine-protein kinase catalytic domain-containing protein n=1 Tax=Rhizophagus irregularis (strain DAOM 197198w) TaxID=1432141 RepID=A0A015KF84_RHIIW|nr:hypothetical protein RirG_199690 [Rhizophagus irregularis DAOM 197198w]